MAEWLIERGIGEDRALLIENGQVRAARLHWPGELVAGQVVTAKLAARSAGSRRGTAVAASGADILLDRLPASASEGSTVQVLVTRAPIGERGRLKRAHGKLLDAGENPPPADADPFAGGTLTHRFPAGLWEDVWSGAWDGEAPFPGGSLLFSVTPAMIVVDVDGDLLPRDLALAAVPALADAVRRFNIGGSVGIDFPTLTAKADRKAVDSALGDALADWPHERTAINGFGFVQLVARLEGPSLLHRIAASRVGAAARMALRRAELVEGPGMLLLTVHPALKARLAPEWLAELARRTGREVRLATDPGLALEGSFAQAVQP